MDREQLRRAVYDRCGVDTDDGLVTADVVNRFINAALHLISIDEDWPWLTNETTVAATAAVGSYVLPDYLRVRQVRVDGDDPMANYEKLELDQRWPSTATRGRPFEWSVSAAGLLLRPYPDTSYSVIVDYIAPEPDLANDSDTPLMPYSFHDAIVERAAVLVFRRTGEISRAGAAAAEYAEWLSQMKKNGTRYKGTRRPRIRPGALL